MKMNTTSIQQRQDEDERLRELHTQRVRYSEAKRIFSALWLLSVPVAVGMACASLLSPNIKPYATIFGLLIPLLDALILMPRQKKLREEAAKFQEQFDTNVLSLPWNESKVGDRPLSDRLLPLEDRQREPFLKWYEGEIDKLPVEQGRILCQIQNIVWDKNQRARYISAMRWALGVLVVLVLAVAVIWNGHFVEVLSTLLPPAAPVAYFLIKQILEHQEAGDRLEKIHKSADKLLDISLKTEMQDPAKCAELTVKSRALQDEIYDSRRRSVPVFDWVYQRLKSEQSIQVSDVVRRHIETARKAQETA